MIAPKLDTRQTTAVASLPAVKADVKDPETLTLILLPSELLVEILRHVDGRSILQCSSVCRTLNRLIDSSAELQYHIELALDCMLDGPPSTVTVSERLEQLRTLRRAWTLFEWKKEVRVPMPGFCHAYELVGGVFAKTFSSASIDHNQSGSRRFISSWLPSSSAPGHMLVRNDIGISTRDFAIDPSQDLIAFVQSDDDLVNNSNYTAVHIRTISSNVKHPEASSPILRTLTPSIMTSAFIQIVDDVIGMMFWMELDNPRITIWNWKTGQILVDRDGEDLPTHISDFSFISNRAYMITRGIDGGSIQVFTFGENQHEIVHVASLSLPLLESRHFVHCAIHTGPFVARCPPNTPFWTNQEERMYVLSVDYIQMDPHIPRARPKFFLFFKNSTPLRYIRKYREQRETSPFEVPWEEWGPHESRMLRHQAPYQWLRYVHGYRVVFPLQSSSMQVMDFNIRKTKRHVFPPQPDSKASIEVIDYPTIIWSDGLFPGSIETNLPYRVCRRDELEGFSGMMIDEQRLVGLKSPSFADGDMKDLHVFAF
ncbi:uncharacterized protein HD556DRAFT_1528034 [Suillus plorans]|uniref:F-box domain-containing protein n=1 Tax=Suillus plorans TaxID=116603 RepID=A0A9P7DFQ0_9AGAM|nr:uncharacterized protein HD556DRAFT_1528034 [Suillus plorans]KAG1792330.1 hypothetical protein HD556DRAFT_1528034 [Suillus plorans]